MTEPTDHRAEAEKWLYRDNATARNHALLAIEQQLHRIADALEAPPDNQPELSNVEADYTEDGQIIPPDRWDPKPHRDPSDVRCTLKDERGYRCLLVKGHDIEHRFERATDYNPAWKP
jgi:hypothetical protein